MATDEDNPLMELDVPNHVGSPDFRLKKPRYGVAISWDHSGQKLDIDLQAVVVDDKGCIIDAVYYNNLKALKALTHSGDEQTGEKSGLDEVIWVNMNNLPANVRMIIFVVAAYAGGHLKDAQNGRIHILEEKADKEVARYAMEKSEEEVDIVGMMLREPDNSWGYRVLEMPAEDGRHFIDILEPTIGNLIRSIIPSAPKRQKVAFAMDKGAVVDLPRSSAIKCIKAGLGWDASRGGEIDLDVSAVTLTGPPAKVEDTCFFGQLEITGVKHSGDNLTGEGDGDDEIITVDLEKVKPGVSQIYFVINIYTRGCTFEKVKNAYCHIVTQEGEELARYELKDGRAQQGLLMARLFRERGNERWGFQALGSFCRGNTWKDSVNDICTVFGMTPQALQLKGQSTLMLDGSSAAVNVAQPTGSVAVAPQASPPPAPEKQGGCCVVL
eukprot:gnl/MRDRNA2_/MRDRNA2_85357_c0_seq2.p1 gnl/MRDRNA2_/MRDRNA2_85357_c0~~gnl/MRDRNA2_/MRDRNA2_85357_c0_seq2.p1  ORF type:complete len:439 (+),score=84.62 gnl/MRDRNA2_/MRDRNA2_85357_c0_seq2:121-1437(+)